MCVLICDPQTPPPALHAMCCSWSSSIASIERGLFGPTKGARAAIQAGNLTAGSLDALKASAHPLLCIRPIVTVAFLDTATACL